MMPLEGVRCISMLYLNSEAREEAKARTNLYRFKAGRNQAVQPQRCQLGKHNPRPGEEGADGCRHTFPFAFWVGRKSLPSFGWCDCWRGQKHYGS
jgi:hypothetical protein